MYSFNIPNLPGDLECSGARLEKIGGVEQLFVVFSFFSCLTHSNLDPSDLALNLLDGPVGLYLVLVADASKFCSSRCVEMRRYQPAELQRVTSVTTGQKNMSFFYSMKEVLTGCLPVAHKGRTTEMTDGSGTFCVIKTVSLDQD